MASAGCPLPPNSWGMFKPARAGSDVEIVGDGDVHPRHRQDTHAALAASYSSSASLGSSLENT